MLSVEPGTSRPPPEALRRRATPASVALYCASALVLFLAMRYRLGAELADDGAFFLRYANNMASGHFWVWNLGDPPIWGASAPLYPVSLALPISLGLSPRLAVLAVGFILSVTALAGTAVLVRRFGLICTFSFCIFAALDSGIMYYPTSGLETPLTLAILAIAVRGLLVPTAPLTAGLIAGTLMIQKLDLLPVGLLFLLAYGVKHRHVPRQPLLIAGLIVITWHTFAWLYFGSPLPNAFLTKALHQGSQPKIIDWTWFGNYVFFSGSHRWILPLAFFGIWRLLRVVPSLAIFLVGVITTHLAAYSIKYPFEPYTWYAIPATFSLTLAAAVGVATVATTVRGFLRNPRMAPQLSAALLLGVVTIGSASSERAGTRSIKRFMALQEHDRAEAGRWVDRNAPKPFSVFTSWGNPALFSDRYVLDGSFLNRKFERSDLVARYRPEIIIFQGNPGSTPMNPVFAQKTDGYRTVKLFDSSFDSGLDYYFAVLARNDVLDRLKNIELPVDLMAYVRGETLGDTWGMLKPQGADDLFIHPGGSSPTRFSFLARDYLLNKPNPVLTLEGRMSPAIPKAAIARGGGVVSLRVSLPGETLLDATVDPDHPVHLDIPASQLASPLEFVVDNHGNPDSDWFLLSIR